MGKLGNEVLQVTLNNWYNKPSLGGKKIASQTGRYITGSMPNGLREMKNDGQTSNFKMEQKFQKETNNRIGGDDKIPTKGQKLEFMGSTSINRWEPDRNRWYSVTKHYNGRQYIYNSKQKDHHEKQRRFFWNGLRHAFDLYIV